MELPVVLERLTPLPIEYPPRSPRPHVVTPKRHLSRRTIHFGNLKFLLPLAKIFEKVRDVITPLASATLVALLATAPLAHAEPTASDLQRRLAEQERQIRQLELENERLRSLVEPQASEAARPSAASLSAAAPPAAPRTYTVRSGDTLSRIARRHHTTPEALAKLNNLRNASLIRPGQNLKLPVVPALAEAAPKTKDEPAPKPTPAPTPAPQPSLTEHTVRSGETFYSIAREHGITADALARANPEANPRSLRIGQRLAIPTATSPQPAENGAADAPSTSTVSNQPRIRSVRIDEEITFGEFASRHGMTIPKLNALNGLSLESKTLLAKGSELYVSAQP